MGDRAGVGSERDKEVAAWSRLPPRLQKSGTNKKSRRHKLPPGTVEPRRCSSGLWAKFPASVNPFDAKRVTQGWIGPSGEGLLPSVQATERSSASWGVRLRDSKGLRHLNLLGTQKKCALSDFKVESVFFFFSESSFEDLCLLLFLIKK